MEAQIWGIYLYDDLGTCRYSLYFYEEEELDQNLKQIKANLKGSINEYEPIGELMGTKLISLKDISSIKVSSEKIPF
ncbi:MULTISPECIES: hypothetical protein [Aerococcus]|uniref:Uncharacterized protein n=2 Tax=Aerococcus TaxID=1375 RepID=A0A1E9PGU5_9LACT|nr:MULTISPECIES: hypothetical protein [Aerococcus]MBU5611095.1 hypothetical protein [Aerococcus urinae]MCY3034008.1 hypothetical protein [Aerococcus mictus]MCY3065776.1 hypothetical protein [Aerococcus mictus]MCY3066468.1 hypothetical protein [Aerococcus mictus]MCY3071393.1 hypothetical protein [Aerococcus mictus]